MNGPMPRQNKHDIKAHGIARVTPVVSMEKGRCAAQTGLLLGRDSLERGDQRWTGFHFDKGQIHPAYRYDIDLALVGFVAGGDNFVPFHPQEQAAEKLCLVPLFV